MREHAVAGSTGVKEPTLYLRTALRGARVNACMHKSRKRIAVYVSPCVRACVRACVRSCVRAYVSIDRDLYLECTAWDVPSRRAGVFARAGVGGQYGRPLQVPTYGLLIIG